jgi:hypothetical protein
MPARPYQGRKIQATSPATSASSETRFHNHCFFFMTFS